MKILKYLSWFFSKESRAKYYQASIDDFEKVEQIRLSNIDSFEGLYISPTAIHYRIWPKFEG